MLLFISTFTSSLNVHIDVILFSLILYKNLYNLENFTKTQYHEKKNSTFIFIIDSLEYK